MKHLCVFCGSRMGANATFEQAATRLAQVMVQQKIDLVYGGSIVGLMGLVANTVLAGGGKAYGVIPNFLGKKEIAHSGLTELHMVETMHQRKQKMADMSDGFFCLPGGIGTLDELAEIFAWSYLGLHRKPIGLLNLNGYYEPLLAFFNTMVTNGFMPDYALKLLVVDATVEGLVEKMQNFSAPDVPSVLQNLNQT